MTELQKALEEGRFVVTGEIGPPKGTDIDKVLDEIECWRGKVTAVNVTDNQSAVMRFSSLAACRLLLDRGFEPVLQMVCRDRNRIALQSDLLGAFGLGIRNVLCITGDHNVLGDHPGSKPVFDLDAVSLLHAASTLMQGKDLEGNELDGVPSFYLGAVVSPCAEPVEPQLWKMKKKVAAGARFFQTQAVYDADAFKRFMEQARELVPEAKVLVGIVLLKSVGMARFMNANVAGVHVPDALIKRLKADKEKTKSGRTAVEIAAELIREVKDVCDGVHLMPLGWDHLVPEILEEAGL